MSFTKGHSAGATLRELLAGDGPVIAPGVGDAVSARLAEAAGFRAVCMSGAWAASLRGYPDVGLITLPEMIQSASYIADAVDIPVAADADTGFGDIMNVRRCVRDFERAGIAGIHIEDQSLPKKCGLLGGKRLVPTADMVRKLHMACDARRGDDFVIIARTDALQAEGLNATIERATAYFDAGADMLFVEGFQREEDIHAVAQAFAGRSLFFNRTPRGYAPMLTIDELFALGFNFIVFPMHLVLLAAAVQRQLLEELASTGTCDSFESQMLRVEDYFEIVGHSALEELDRKYAATV
jgi:2,3-dimethylmalate lyase